MPDETPPNCSWCGKPTTFEDATEPRDCYGSWTHYKNNSGEDQYDSCYWKYRYMMWRKYGKAYTKHMNRRWRAIRTNHPRKLASIAAGHLKRKEVTW